MECPSCQEFCTVKSGYNKSGTQRYYCKGCKAYFTPVRTLKGEKDKYHILSMYLLYDQSLRFIAKQFNLHHQTVKTLVETEQQTLRKKADDLIKRGLSSNEILSEMIQESPDGFLAIVAREDGKEACSRAFQTIMKKQNQPKPIRESARKVIPTLRLDKTKRSV